MSDIIHIEKSYNVIYADPPWSYRNKKTGGSMVSGSMVSGSMAKYPTMTIAELKELPVKHFTDRNAVLFLWATVPLMPEAIDLMQAWGFKYKTMLTWRKVMSLGMGFWFRGQCEHLLLGVKGNVKAFRMQVPNFHQSKVERHSKKPLHFRELIDQCAAKTFKQPKKLELFARYDIIPDGWNVYGNETPNSIQLKRA